VIEATVHLTRYVMSKNDELIRKINYYCKLAEKCGGEREKVAVRKLREYIEKFTQ